MLKHVIIIKIFMEKVTFLTQAYEFPRHAIKPFGVCKCNRIPRKWRLL